MNELTKNRIYTVTVKSGIIDLQELSTDVLEMGKHWNQILQLIHHDIRHTSLLLDDNASTLDLYTLNKQLRGDRPSLAGDTKLSDDIIHDDAVTA